MFSLIIMGTILDDVTYCSDIIRGDGKASMIVAFLIYIVIASFMMMNMLLGILVEVVGNSAEGEKKIMKEANFREAVTDILLMMDKNTDASISKDEFKDMRGNEALSKVLADMG